MRISRARTIAFDVLLRVAHRSGRDAFADEALRGALEESVKAEDARLATELVFGVLRWQRLLDFVLTRQLVKAPKALDVEVRIALRLGAYQLLFLDRVPARAAVHESVELTKRARKSSAASLVNAVLRKTAKVSLPARVPWDEVSSLLPGELARAEQLGIQYSHPTWIVERWLQTFGDEKTCALLRANNRVPSVSGYLFEPERREDATRVLQCAGCCIRPGLLLRDAWVLEGGRPSASEAVRQGWVAIQDEASQAVAHLVGVRPGDRVLDLCAAPGGKALLLSRAAGPQGNVIAADLREDRVKAMQERFAQADVRNVETIVLDGTEPLPFERPFDRILVDVPCTGTGTLARHPEIRWKLKAEDLSDLHARQVRLLRNALPLLVQGGRLVYSTCSLEPEENEKVVGEALTDLGNQFRAVSALRDIAGILQNFVSGESLVSADGFFRTFPAGHGTDGFFAALLERPHDQA